MTNQPILAFDCATIGGSVALMVNGAITTQRIGRTAQAAELIPAIDALMRAANLHYADLGAIVSTVGPGSFTGVRIGLAALHGLVLVHATPLKMLTTLEAMAWAVAVRADAPATFEVALRAGKGELYCQRFACANAIPTPTSDIRLMPETFDGWEAPCFGNHLPVDTAGFIDGPDAQTLVTIAHHLPVTSLADALPVYVRPPDAIIGAPHPWLVRN